MLSLELGVGSEKEKNESVLLFQRIESRTQSYKNRVQCESFKTQGIDDKTSALYYRIGLEYGAQKNA